MTTETFDAALRYTTVAGFSVIPTTVKTKRPYFDLLPKGADGKPTWDPFKVEIANEKVLRQWFTNRNACTALVFGRVSGSAELIDFDHHPPEHPRAFEEFAALLDDLAPGLLARLVIAKTQRDGRHLIYRCAEIAGSQKLAQYWTTDPETGNPKTETLIETRGEGGYALCAPSPGYQFLQGDPATVPTITVKERGILLELARSFDAVARDETPISTTAPAGAQKGANADGLQPGDDYNQRTEVADLANLLTKHGWTEIARRGDVIRFRRPGKKDGISATLNHIPGKFYVFSSNAYPFDLDRAYDPFGVYARLEHGGDFTAATRELGRQGYGSQPVHRRNGDGAHPADAAVDREPPPWIGAGGEDLTDAGTPPPTDESAAKPTRKKVKSHDLIAFLTEKGYHFRLNQCDDSVEVNGERISDVIRAKMRTQLRDRGYGKYLAAADDAAISDAARNAYHPVRDYLKGLKWDGGAHIAKLAGYVTDANQVFPLYLRKWLIGAIARAYTGTQNAVLVLDGPQGLGKSQFVRWLCPLQQLFVDSNINPDDKDCGMLAIRSWIWEVSELGATTKRADMEALKGFLSREVFTLRPAYARYEIVKPGLASFVGTVNNSSGIFSDPTGSRRYWATTLTALDWGYTHQVNLAQVWAEAHSAYLAGETWTLTTDQAVKAKEVNDEYAFADPVEDLLRKFFILDPKANPEDERSWTSTADILTVLQNNGLGQQAHSNSMRLSATLKRLGHEKRRGGHDGKINGYVGVWEIGDQSPRDLP